MSFAVLLRRASRGALVTCVAAGFFPMGACGDSPDIDALVDASSPQPDAYVSPSLHDSAAPTEDGSTREDAGSDSAVDGPGAEPDADAAIDGTVLVDGEAGSIHDASDGSIADAPTGIEGDATSARLDAASFDAADSAPNVCGDGVRDPVNEECDDGTANANAAGACSTNCQVQDFLASSSVSSVDAGPLLPFQYPPHTLGHGRHPLAAGPGGFAVGFLEEEGSGDFTLRAEAFDPGGARVASFSLVGTPSAAMASADPVIAPLSSTRYATVWTAPGAGTGGLGIAMATLDTSSSSVGPVSYASAATATSATAPDALWVGGSLVVAWADDSGVSSSIELRTFDATLKATSAEVSFAAPSVDETAVALAPFNATWAAAWWASAADGTTTVHVRSGATEIATSPVVPGIAGERPALVQIGPTTLLVVFGTTVATDDAGDETTTVLEGAVIDLTSGAATVAPSELRLDAQADGGDGRFPEGAPTVLAANGQVWLSAWTGGQVGDPLGDEVWLSSVAMGAASSIGSTVMPLPRWSAHRAGDQESPRLAVTTLAPNGALVGVWEDDGAGVGGAEARPDVVLEVVPLPMVR